MCFFLPLTSSVKKMALDEPMAIIIESSLSGQGKQGNMSVSCFSDCLGLLLLLFFFSYFPKYRARPFGGLASS
jgi:hypothetical protein